MRASRDSNRCSSASPDARSATRWSGLSAPARPAAPAGTNRAAEAGRGSVDDAQRAGVAIRAPLNVAHSETEAKRLSRDIRAGAPRISGYVERFAQMAERNRAAIRTTSGSACRVKQLAGRLIAFETRFAVQTHSIAESARERQACAPCIGDALLRVGSFPAKTLQPSSCRFRRFKPCDVGAQRLPPLRCASAGNDSGSLGRKSI